MDDGLSFDDHQIVQAGRQVLASTIERLAPPEKVVQLVCVGIAGLFADLLTHSTGAKDLATVVNQQIEQSRWRLLQLTNN